MREPNDIISYAALAAIAIQSNQNDQHGGQSIPYFDYSLAEGVAKTFRKCYINNIYKALNLYKDIEYIKSVKDIINELEEKTDYKISIKLSDNIYRRRKENIKR